MKARAEAVRRLLERAREACGGEGATGTYWVEMALTIGVLEHVHSLVTDESLIHPNGKQVLVCAAQHRPRSDPQDLGDLVAVQLRAHGVQLLLLQQARDTGLEVVVRA